MSSGKIATPPQPIDKLGVVIDPDARVEQLTRTEKALVAVSRALGSNADIIVMDEPTASPPANEVARLFDAIERLRGAGVAVMYVSHRLDEVFRIADFVVVLRDGRVVGRSPVGDITPESLVVQIVSAASRRRSFADQPLRSATRF
jgi:ribose transport system ATP-binding protein